VNLDFNLVWWNGLIVHPLMAGLRFIAEPLSTYVSPGLAGGLAIILFTVILRFVLLPLSLTQVKSQKAQMALQPELKEIQRKFKNDREGLAKAQMSLYRERGVNPLAGCLPLLVQMPVLFGMYSALLQLSTEGLTLDRVVTNTVQTSTLEYQAVRSTEPLPFNHFVLGELVVTPRGSGPIQLDVAQDRSTVAFKGEQRLNAVQGLTLTPGQAPGQPQSPNPATGRANIWLRPGGDRLPDGTLNRGTVVEANKPYIVEIVVNTPQTHVDAAGVTISYDAAVAQLGQVVTPPLRDVPFKSSFLWLPSLGEYDIFNMAIPGVTTIPIPGLLLILMTITTFLTTRMTAMPTEDPQQQAMMRTMAIMPLMYLFFFSQTPAGLVLYWLISNIYTMFQQYFTTGLGLLAGDLKRFTGLDLQPPWAQLGTPQTPKPTSDDEDQTEKPAASRRNGTSKAASTRVSKGRNRAKR
jgi:YidC/Oxa1 family membrane protein insertase